jgi:hypothetical protein
VSYARKRRGWTTVHKVLLPAGAIHHSSTLVQAEAPARHYITTTVGAVIDVNIQAAEWKSVKSEGVDDQGTSRPHRRDLPAQAMGWDVIRARLNRLDLLLEISVTNKTTFV